MKYLCVAPDGSLEIWQDYKSFLHAGWHSDESICWMFYFYEPQSYSKMATVSKLPYDPEFWGREVLEEWNE